ncbi:cation acetate symporter [Methyloversatilis universalis]|uniref:cation acetate symporter n=1 Tax=Methyloversatilis universalis TaxID=378211 RepID=UPI00037234BC|nr:cation acetate symporter [Methyloversatilis universalis]
MPHSQGAFRQQLKKMYGWYTGGFVVFVALLAVGEQLGMSSQWIGYTFLFASIALYAAIGVMSRTADVAEYYVAGRRVPALFNGMATGADWMSAASFIGMAGTLYFSGYQGLAFVMGWTGGYCLVALFLAPYLRKFGEFTIPDFLGARYGGNLARMIGVIAAILASFTYVVAQIYGVGLITSRFVGLEFEVGVFVGLAGILVCSFLGGMRAVTWTQVAQYIILIIAYLLPVVILSTKVTGVPVPQAMYGQVLQKLSAKESELFASPKELEANALFKARAHDYEEKIRGLPASLDAERAQLTAKLDALKAANAPAKQIAAAEMALRNMPKTEADARRKWGEARRLAESKAKPPLPHTAAHAGRDEADASVKRLNFIALVIVLMVGTASLPHILMRYYTTPSVKEARDSVFWSLFFIFLLYVTAPAYAVFAKWEVYTNLVGSTISTLPGWVASWGKVGLVKIDDINADGILQLAELTLNTDVIVLATPEIAGLPYVISGLVAAGGLAAALSTADGLLLTIANAMSHDMYYKVIDPDASTQRRLVISKALLLVVALVAAYTASLKPDNILLMVGLAFSIAASAFFPALVCGVFWARANKPGAVAGMMAGLGMCIYYAATTHPFFGGDIANAWFGIEPISCGIFGIPLGFAVLIVVSLMTRAPDEDTRALVQYVRYPNLGESPRTLPRGGGVDHH